MAVATLVPIGEYLSTSWDPDREYVEGRRLEWHGGELEHGFLPYLIAKRLDQKGLLPFTELRVQVKPNPFGVPNIWALDPKRRRITVHGPEGARLCAGEVRTSDSTVSIPLADVFATMPVVEE